MDVRRYSYNKVKISQHSQFCAGRRYSSSSIVVWRVIVFVFGARFDILHPFVPYA